MNQAQVTPPLSRFTGAIEILLLCALLSALVCYFNGITGNDLFSKSLQDSGHAAVFFIATLILTRALSLPQIADRLGKGLVIPIAFFGAILTGIVIELVQPWFGRSGSFLDIWYDLLGCTAAVLVFAAKERITARSKQVLAIIAACVLLSIGGILPAYFHQVISLRNAAFPEMFNAQERWQSELFHTNRGAYANIVDAPTEWTENQSKVLRLDMSHGQYPGIVFQHLPKDWSQYSTLKIDVFSKQKRHSSIVIRVDDALHNQEHSDRFNMQINIAPGANNIEVPLQEIQSSPVSRALRLTDIYSLIVFSTDARADQTLYLDNLRLN